jgi:hypothetical protein
MPNGRHGNPSSTRSSISSTVIGPSEWEVLPGAGRNGVASLVRSENPVLVTSPGVHPMDWIDGLEAAWAADLGD